MGRGGARMTWGTFSLILTGVLLNAAAQFCLKAGVNRVGIITFHMQTLVRDGLALAFSPFILAGLSCYVISVVVWLLALSRVPVSVAYPMLSIGYIVTAVAAWLFLGESLDAMRIIGIGIIILGVFLVART